MTSRLGRIRLGNPATGVEELALERERDPLPDYRDDPKPREPLEYPEE